jgi:hypothetical protein
MVGLKELSNASFQCFKIERMKCTNLKDIITLNIVILLKMKNYEWLWTHLHGNVVKLLKNQKTISREKQINDQNIA